MNKEIIEILDKIIEASCSHIDGRFLFDELSPRKTLDIKKRVDGVETWHEGDWLTELGHHIKHARDYLAELQAEPTDAEIERVAKVIYEETKHWGHEYISIELAKPIARAAIKAMRE